MLHSVRFLKTTLLLSLCGNLLLCYLVYDIHTERDGLHLDSFDLSTLRGGGQKSQNKANSIQRPPSENQEKTDEIQQTPITDWKTIVEEVKRKMVKSPSRDQEYNLNFPDSEYHSQRGQDRLVAAMFKYKKHGTFFEAGALDGEKYSNTLHFERQLGWTGLLVEPSSNNFQTMRNKSRKASLLNAAISPDETSSVQMFEVKAVGTGQLLEKRKANKVAKDGMEEVFCYPLYAMLQAYGNTNIDFMSLDIEGNEFKVLSTIPWSEVQVGILSVEVVHLHQDKQPLVELLEANGYVLHGSQVEDYIFYNKAWAADLDLQVFPKKRVGSL